MLYCSLTARIESTAGERIGRRGESMSDRSRKRIVLVVAVAFFVVTVLALAALSRRANDGHLVYALDDAYIHMAIARNVAEHGVFGISSSEFSSASSSPLWTMLLASIDIAAGDAEWTPLALNLLFGALALVVAFLLAGDAGIGGLRLPLLLGAIVLLTPMAPMAMVGMEHLLHLCAALFLLYALWPFLGRGGKRRSSPFLLCAAALLAVGARYESLFLVAAALIVLAARGQWRGLIACTVGAAIPVGIFGIFSVAHGQYFLPNTLLLKSGFPHLGNAVAVAKRLGIDGFKTLAYSPHLYVLVIALVALFWRGWAAGKPYDRRNLPAIIVVAAAILHVQFARTGWFYRYEAYLVGLSVMALAIGIARIDSARVRVSFRSRSIATMACLAVTLLVAGYPLARRAAACHAKTVQATRNIYQQQYQMGRFLHRYYEGEAVAANDVGAINYLARIDCLDLWGLASHEVARRMRNGCYDTGAISEIADERGVRIALVYEPLFARQCSLPGDWTPVGSWTIRNNVVCGGTTVTFFAIDQAEVGPLAAHLESFAGELPPEVTWRALLDAPSGEDASVSGG